MTANARLFHRGPKARIKELLAALVTLGQAQSHRGKYTAN